MSTLHSIRAAVISVVGVAAVVLLASCDEIDKMNENAAKRPPITIPNQVADAPGNQVDSTSKTENTAATADANPAPATDANASPAPQGNTTMERATSGVGVQGQGYGGGIITEPVHQYFAARDRITFDIQIPKQMQIWKAMNNNRNPKNFAEYKKEILDPCQIDLPELPQGRHYVYDAKTGELMVESGGPQK